jgi:hypothetical protein
MISRKRIVNKNPIAAVHEIVDSNIIVAPTRRIVVARKCFRNTGIQHGSVTPLIHLTMVSFGENANIWKDKDTKMNPSRAVSISDARHTAANTAAFSEMAL